MTDLPGNDNWQEATENALDDADGVVNAFASRHGGLAIPALIGACAEWAVRNGRHKLMKVALQEAIPMTDDLRAMHVRGMS